MARRPPKILSTLAVQIKKRGRGRLDTSASFAAATVALQAAGILKKGTSKLTKRGRRLRP